MKNNCRLFGIIIVLIIISLACIACEEEQPYYPDYTFDYIYKESWYYDESWYFVFYQYNENVTDNQYNITANKFKTAFSSDLLTDEERVKLREHFFVVNINPPGELSANGNFGITPSYSYIHFEIYIPCDVLQNDINNFLKKLVELIEEESFNY